MQRIFKITSLIIICVLAFHIRNIYAVDASINSRVGKIGTYMVKFSEVTLENVSHFAYLFNIKEGFFEDETAFVFTNKNEQLTVYKHLNQINYKLLRLDRYKEAVLENDADAARVAVNFLKQKKLPF